MSDILKTFLEQEGAIKKYLLRFFSSRQDVEDVAQEVFIKAFATEIRTDVRHPKYLLFRAAKHAALSELEKKQNHRASSLEDMEGSPVLIDSRDHDAERILDGKRKLAALSRAIADLPPVCRKVFVLRKVEGLPMKEVAARLKISVSTAEKHAVSGVVKCTRRLREMGYDSREFGGAREKSGLTEGLPSRQVTEATPDGE